MPEIVNDPTLRLRFEQLTLEPGDLSGQIVARPLQFVAGPLEFAEGLQKRNDLPVANPLRLRVEAHASFLQQSLPRARHNPVEKESKRLFARLKRLVTAGKHGPPALETLREKTEPGTVPVDRLHTYVRRRFAKTAPRQRIFPQRVLNQSRESVEGLPHVDAVAIGQDPPNLRREHHGSALEPLAGAPPLRPAAPDSAVRHHLHRALPLEAKYPSMSADDVRCRPGGKDLGRLRSLTGHGS